MADDIVVKVEHVSKDFILPHEKVTSFKRAFTGMFSRNHTKEVQHALKDVSFEIKKGEFFGIVGRNGSGKSTLLKILASIYQPTGGAVHTTGKLVPFIELGVGFNPELTGRENVYLNGAMLGFSEKEVDAMYKEIVDFAELERFMDQKLKNYSSGMQVRLAFSVATRSEADILLVDEVLAVGDADFQHKCFDYFKGLKKTGKTVVFVTHDMNAVREYCDRVVLIDEGKIAHQGKPERVADEYLKLFNAQNILDKENEAHWGDGRVRIDSLTVKCTSDEFVLKATLKTADVGVGGVRFGFRIKDQDGYLVSGTNNLNAINAQKLVFEENDTKVLTFRASNIFGNQTYTVDASIASLDNTVIFDTWEAVAKFRSLRSNAYYPIIYPAELTLG